MVNNWVKGFLICWLAVAFAQDAALSSTATEVEVIIAQEGKLEISQSTTVRIEAQQESNIAASTSGRVLQIYKQQDEMVGAGEPVLELDTEVLRLQEQNALLEIERATLELEQAQQANSGEVMQASSLVNAAEIKYNSVEKQYVEAQKLYESGNIARIEVERLEAELALAEAELAAHRNELSRSERGQSEGLAIIEVRLDQAQNQLGQIRETLDQAVLSAPFTGTIVEMLVGEGEYVTSGQPAFVIASTEEQVARFSVPLEVAEQMVERGIIYLKYNDLDYGVKILTVSDLNIETQLAQVTAQLYASQNRIPNGTVTVLPYKFVAAEGLLVPRDAVQRDGGQVYVYKLVDDMAVRQKVLVTFTDAANSVVTGIDVGEPIIYPVPSGLVDGDTVAVAD